MKKIFKSIHPFLFTIYPILYLYSENIGLLSFADIRNSLLASLGLVSFFLVFLNFKLKNVNQRGEKVAIFLSICSLLFFSYGHFFNITREMAMSYLSPGSVLNSLLLDEGVILSIFILGLAAPSFFLFSKIVQSNKINDFNNFLNITSFALILISVLSIASYGAKGEHINIPEGENYHNSEANQLAEKTNLPDIYYIVLDGYGREDVLKNIYDYDNSEFINFLEDKGFYIADKSRSNYCQSCLSVASFLNLRYINYLEEEMGPDNHDRSPLKELFEKNKTVEFLKSLGYKFINFPVGYFCINESPLADLNINFGSWLSDRMFERLLAQTTILKPLVKTTGLGAGDDPVHEKRRKALDSFSVLETIPEMDAPTFVYAHLMVPHPPFVFNSDGGELKKETFCFLADGDWWQKRCGREEDYIREYKNQLIYTNSLVKKTIEVILEKSEKPPLIVLQADHGPGAQLKWDDPEKTNMTERMGILNAYYLPGEVHEELYPSVTPVNSLRIIFNTYFGTDYELLEDKSYFSTWSKPYDFIEVSEEE